MKLIRQCISMAVLGLSFACGGGGGSTGPSNNNNNGNNPPPGGGNTALDNITLNFTQAAMSAGDVKVINVVARDTQGAVIAGATANFTSSDDTIAEVNSSGSVLAIHAGSAQVAVSVTVGSVTKSANVSVTVSGTLPTSATVYAGPDWTFQPGTTVVAAGSVVTWSFGSVEHTVNFITGGASAPNAIGNSYNSNVQRMFPAKGNYQYMCSIHYGMSGEIIVR